MKAEELKKALFHLDLRRIKDQVKKLTQYGKLGPLDKLYISQGLVLMGEAPKALKLIGGELSHDELQTVGTEVLALQGQLAYVLAIIGARYSARRLFKNVEDCYSKRGADPLVYNEHYYLQKIHAYRIWSDFNICLQVCDKALLAPKLQTISKLFYLEEKAKALTGLRRELESNKISLQWLELSKQEKVADLLIARVLLNMAINYLGLGNLDLADEYINKAEPFYSRLGDLPKTRPFFLVKSIFLILSGKFDEAKKQIAHSIPKESEDKQNPAHTLLCLYWKSQIPQINITFDEQMLIRTHHSYIPYRHLLGMPFEKSNLERPWCLGWEEKYKTTANDCWLVNASGIQAIKYSEKIKELFQHKKVHDLFSGHEFTKGEISNSLSQIQQIALSSILQAGKLGISRWALMDRVYHEENFDFTTGESRFKSLINMLRKFGYSIELKKNFYYSPINPQYTYIFPMQFPEGQTAELVKALFPSFKRSELEAFLKISKATALRHINDWSSKSLISYKDNTYFFN